MKDFEQRVLERMPSSEEERASLGHVWNQVERAGGQIPDDARNAAKAFRETALRSVRQRSASRHQRAWALLPRAVAAVLVLGVAIGTAIVWPRGVRVYAAGNDGLQVTLADDSRVEMRAHSEMTVGRASDGIQIDLKTGDIIVNAAKQRTGHLYVQTKDMTVSVVGTVFLVNAGQDGSRVAVIEGEVRVRDGTVETNLRPGEQMSSRPTPAAQVRPVIEEIAWSRRKDAYLTLLQSAVAAAPANQQASTPPAASSQAATAEFEEASIRECDPNNLPPAGARSGGANTLRMTPGRTYGTCLTLATLVRIAYGEGLLDGPELFSRAQRARGLDQRAFAGIGAMRLNLGYYLVEDGRRVRGGPDWVRDELYTIEAAASEPADAQTMRGPMLRALLERRFELKVHVETEQIPALKMTVAPGGLKMKEGICTKSETPSQGGRGPAAEPLGVLRSNLDAVRRGAPTTGRCGGMAGALNGPNFLIVGMGSAVSALSDQIGNILEVPIVDRTGVPDTALFNYALELVPDDSLPRKFRDQFAAAGGEMQIASEPSAVPRAPGIFTALEEQLGLKIERTRAPQEFIVIDHVERPSPN